MTDQGFYFSEKKLNEEVLADYLSDRESLEDDIIFIPYSQIKKVTPFTENQPPLLDIEVLDPENYQTIVADFENKSQAEEAIKQVETHAGLKERIEVLKDKSWVRSALYAVASSFFGYALIVMAQEIEAGGELDITGRRSGVKKIFASIAEQLGVIGSAGLAIAIFAVFAYLAFKAYKNSITKQTVWE